MSLQTLAYIQTIQNLFTNVRCAETKEESTLLSDFVATQVLLTHTFGISYLALLWNADGKRPDIVIQRRKTLIRSLDVSFHRHYKKLCDSFKKVRYVFLHIAPGIKEQTLAVYVPAVQELLYSYNRKSEMLQRLLYRDFLYSVVVKNMIMT